METTFKGTINAVSVYPREVVRRALELNANAVIIAHNHPNGETKPSMADIRMTEMIKAALRTVEINLLDHFIIDPNGINKPLSFADGGLL